ncbi:hypothetical protein ACHAPM_003672 [Fusarium culmorum]
MDTYGFDGVDLDWEYPVDSDRGGRAVDFANFPKWMERLKSTLDSSKKGLTITISASYWYLQHFDIKSLAKSIEFFNVMSYDLHGVWDQDKKWTGSFLNAHTNVTEIDLALDLLWRNDIDPGQVVMGMGFYGRVFTATSKSCMEPGCTFSSGGKKGDCSRETGILLNSEIDTIIEKLKITPQLFRKEAVKVATWGDQWVAYDDEETFKLKSAFAQSRCLGGLMIWAISHDTKDAKYNKILGNVALRSIDTTKKDVNVVVDISNDQCKWTNCKQTCPKGWVAMPRSDPGARKGELMLDETGCYGGVHTFCCPSSAILPTCGWYGHHNGNCDSTCPENTIEIGSLNKDCKNKQKYQAGCCTYNSESMQLYNTCEWGKYPNCDDQTGCSKPLELIASSYSGSGSSKCDWLVNKMGEEYGISQRKYCCDTSDKEAKFENCKTYSHLGPQPTGEPEGYCRSGCPDGKVRVAMDEQPIECDAGRISTCCDATSVTKSPRENPKIHEFEDAMKEFMKDPICSNPGPVLSKRSLAIGDFDTLSMDTSGNASQTHALLARAKDNGSIKAAEVLFMIIAKAGTDKLLTRLNKIWNDAVCKKFPNLCQPGLVDVIVTTDHYKREGPKATAHDVICHMNNWDARIEWYNGKGDGSQLLTCSSDECVIEEDGACRYSDGDPEKEISSPAQNSKSLSRRSHEHHHAHFHQRSKRAGRSTRVVELPNGEIVTYTRMAYDDNASTGELDPIRDGALLHVDRDDCSNTQLRRIRAEPVNPNDPNRRRTRWENEHLVDPSRLDAFIRDAARGELPSGTVSRFGEVTASFFRAAQTMPLGLNVPPLRGGANHAQLWDRVSECFGSRENRGNFVFLIAEINYVKGKLMQFSDPIRRDRWKKLCQDFNNASSREKILGRMRNSLSNTHYLNRRVAPDVNTRLTNIVNDVETQLRHAQNLWNANHPNDQTRIADFWREWAIDQFDHLVAHTRTWAGDLIAEMRRWWGVSTHSQAADVLEVLNTLEAELATIHVDTTRFRQPPP